MSQKKGRQSAPEPASSTTAPAVPDALLKDVDQAVATKPGPKKIKVKKSKTEEEAAQPAAEESSDRQSTNLDDQETDEAVQAIAVDEADTILALQDVANDTEEEERLKRRKTWIDLGVFLVLLIAFVAVMLTRNELAHYYQNVQSWLHKTI